MAGRYGDDNPNMKYYNEYRNGYYNPDDEINRPGVNVNWKDIQQGFKLVEDKDTEQDGKFAAIEEKDEEQDNEIKAIKEKNEEQDNEIKAIKEKNEEQDNEIKTIKEKDEEQDNEIKAIKEKNEEQDNKIKVNTDSIAKNSENIATNKQEIQNETERNTAQDLSIADNSTRITKLESDLEGYIPFTENSNKFTIGNTTSTTGEIYDLEKGSNNKLTISGKAQSWPGANDVTVGVKQGDNTFSATFRKSADSDNTHLILAKGNENGLEDYLDYNLDNLNEVYALSKNDSPEEKITIYHALEDSAHKVINEANAGATGTSKNELKLVGLYAPTGLAYVAGVEQEYMMPFYGVLAYMRDFSTPTKNYLRVGYSFRSRADSANQYGAPQYIHDYDLDKIPAVDITREISTETSGQRITTIGLNDSLARIEATDNSIQISDTENNSSMSLGATHDAETGDYLIIGEKFYKMPGVDFLLLMNNVNVTDIASGVSTRVINAYINAGTTLSGKTCKIFSTVLGSPGIMATGSMMGQVEFQNGGALISVNITTYNPGTSAITSTSISLGTIVIVEWNR